MNLVMFGWFTSSEAFGNLSDEALKELLYSRTLQEIEDDLPPVGIFDNKSSSLGGAYDDLIEQEKRFNDL